MASAPLVRHNENQANVPWVIYTVNTEWGRLFSYSRFSLSFNVSAIHLARYGFYLNNTDELKCYACGVTVKEWPVSYGHPLTIHRELSPHCLHINGKIPQTSIIHGNASIIKQILVAPNGEIEAPLYTLNGCNGNRNTLNNDQNAPLSIEESTSTPKKTPIEHRLPNIPDNEANDTILRSQHSSLDDVASVSSRTDTRPSTSFATHSGNINNANISVSTEHRRQNLDMANKNTLSPSAALTSHASKKSNATSAVEHNRHEKHHNPANQYSNRNAPKDGSSSANNTSTTEQHMPESKPSPQTTYSTQNENKSSSSTSLGVNIEKPKYPAYAILCTRLQTFQEWPLKESIGPNAIAEAGFFYIGHADYTRCFFCAGGLKNWEPEDDPWVEHARWFPMCVYLRMNKGDDFIKCVQDAAEEAGQLNISQEGASNSKNPSSNSKEVETAIAAVDANGRKKEENVESMWSLPAVQSVMEMGYSKEELTKAISSLGKRADNISAAELMGHILDAQEKDSGIGTVSSEATGDNGDRHLEVDSDADSEEEDLWNERETLLEQETCRVCRDRKIETVLVPCGHYTCCIDCAPARRTCPSCHERVNGVVRVFMA